MSGLRLALLLGHCAAAANAFIPSSVYYESAGNTLAELQASQGALHRVWDQPADTLSQAGLGGGLTYAFDPQLCGKILPLFSEDIAGIEFIDCASIRAAWGRALATWAVHHPKLSFVDVTGECAESGDWSGGPVAGEGCSLAEIWVTAKAADTSLSDAAASASTSYVYTHAFHHTDGRTASAGIFRANGSVVGFNVEAPMCWYLDSLFCSSVHGLKSSMGSAEALTLVQALLWGSFCLALLSTVYVAQDVICRHYHLHEMDGEVGLSTQEELLEAEADEEKRTELRESLAMQGVRLLDNVSKISIAATSLRLLLLWAPPMLYVFIFLPCWSCYDFEAAAVHEIGHSLGLMHPDQAAPYGNDLAWRRQATLEDGGGAITTSWKAAKCDNPWEDVEQMAFDVEAPESVMTSFTQFNKEVCLQQDDLDALNTLYPVCLNRVLHPQCFKAESYIGLVRLSVFVGLPVTLMMWLIVACHSLIVRWERWRREQLRADHEELMGDLERELIKVKQHGQQLKRQQSALRQQQVKYAWVGAFKTTAARDSRRVLPSDVPANSTATPHRPKRMPNLHRRSPIAAAVAAVAAARGATANAQSEVAMTPACRSAQPQNHAHSFDSLLVTATEQLQSTFVTPGDIAEANLPTVAECDSFVSE